MSSKEIVAYKFEIQFPHDRGTWYTRIKQNHPEEWIGDDVEYRNVTPLVEAGDD